MGYNCILSLCIHSKNFLNDINFWTLEQVLRFYDSSNIRKDEQGLNHSVEVTGVVNVRKFLQVPVTQIFEIAPVYCFFQLLAEEVCCMCVLTPLGYILTGGSICTIMWGALILLQLVFYDVWVWGCVFRSLFIEEFLS